MLLASRQPGNLRCPRFEQRDANGFIKSVDAIYLNGASFEVAGLDVQARYTFRPSIFAIIAKPAPVLPIRR